MMNNNVKTILVVEDDFEIRNALKEFFELEDYNVLVAENGLDALEVLKKSEMPNLILLDMMMPVMNGWDFASAYYATYTDLAPIIVMTAAVDAMQRAKDIKAVSWAEKPFSFYDLLDKIKLHIK